MEVIPDLADDGTPIVSRVGTSSSGIVSRSATSNIGQSTIAFCQSALEAGQRVLCRVTRGDAGIGEEAPCWQAAVVHDRRLEKVDNLLVLDVFGPVAGYVKG